MAGEGTIREGKRMDKKREMGGFEGLRKAKK